ncbi:MAG TPA: glucosaminidase domain-containing protein, partial [Chloroflexota bacterium]|nr:glucosaminidase domain-containing protein [Chloroflexota bacterium]
MPFLLLDDAKDEATRRLQDFGSGLLQTIGQAGQAVQPGPQVVPPGAALPQAQQNVSDVTSRLQDFGSQQLQAIGQAQVQPSPMTVLQPSDQLQNITQRLQDFGTQALSGAQQLQPLQPLQQKLSAPAPLQTFGQADQQVTGGIDASSPQAFARSVAPYAQEAARQLGIDPTWVASMMTSESNYGKAPGNELFGIKALPGQPGTSLATHEGEYGGTAQNATFASYDTPMDSVNAFVNLIKNHYPGAVGAPDLPSFVHALKQGGYFTAAEPEYTGILQGIGNRIGSDVQAGLQGAHQAVGAVKQAASNVLPAISQFGDQQLTAAQAYAACGPAAAVRFATMMGRQPTLSEAVQLAQTVGWSPDQGMAGLGSESQLFDKMGIPHRMVGADWNALAREAQSGNPVTMSTPGHYFTADAYDPSTGAFHVGSSGTDLRGGSEWMTPEQMEARMGRLQGGMAVDNPQVPGPSPLSQGVQAVAGAAQNVGQKAQQAWNLLNEAVPQVAQGARDLGASAFDTAGRAPLPMTGGTLSDLAAAGRGAQAGLNVVEQQRQEAINRPDAQTQFQNNVDAARRGDWGAFVQGTMDLTGRATDPITGGSEADLSQAVSAGLTAAGVDENTARVLGQVANVAGPIALERTIPAVVSGAERGIPAAGGAALSRGLGWLDVLSPPEEAFAREQPKLSVTDLVSAIQQYPEDVKQGLRNFVQQQTEAGVSGQDINDTLRRWVADNPLRAPEPPTAAVAPPLAPEVPVNPYRLRTKAPEPGAQPLSLDERLDHFDAIQQRYDTIEQQLSDLDDQLNNARGIRPERPPWAVGWTNQGLLELARSQGTSAYEPLWWEKVGMLTGSGEVREDALQSGLKRLGGKQPTPAEVRDQIAALTAERSHLIEAANDLSGHADETPLYRPTAPPTPELPFDTGYTEARGGTAPETVGPAADTGARQGAPVETPAAAETRPGPQPAPPGPVSPEGVAPGFTAPETTSPTATLPGSLARSDPRYSYGAKQFQLQFNNDVEKALYIVAQKNPSKADAQFMEFLRDQFPGESDATIRQMGADVRTRIKSVARTADPADGRLQVPLAEGQPARAPAPTPPPPEPTPAPSPTPSDVAGAAEKPAPPLEALTSREAPPPPPEPPPPTEPTGPAPREPGVVGRILGAPGAAASRFGSLVASALGPVENLPTDTAGVLKNYANMVGRQSDAARVIAENEMRSAGARLDIPAVQEQVAQRRGELRDQAARTLVENLQAQGKAAPIRNAPRELRTVTDDPNTYLANYAFSPDVVGPIKAVTDMGGIAANPLGSSVLKAIGTAKGTLFSLSNFHTLTEALNAGFTSKDTLANYARAFFSDTFAQGLRGRMADTIDAAARAGVTGLAEHARPEDVGQQLGDAIWRRVVSGGVSGAGGAAAGYTETKLTGGTDEEGRANAAKGALAGAALGGLPLGARGTVPEILQSALWDRAVPLAKATAWDSLVKGGLDANQAANVVNERFGGLNYAAMGRNPTLLDAQRLLLQASDWNEATVRQLGSAIFGGDGRGVRAGFLAKTIAGMMVTTE